METKISDLFCSENCKDAGASLIFRKKFIMIKLSIAVIAVFLYMGRVPFE